MKPTYFLFDIGNVLIDWNPRHLLRELIPDAGELDFFLTEVCPQSWNEEQDRGRPWTEALAEASARHPDYREIIHLYFERWMETVAGPIDGTVQLLKSLQEKGYPTYALSNFSVETFEQVERVYPFLASFDGRVVSGYERVIKPDPAIFHLAIDRFGLAPAQTLFIDDHPPNIEAARQLGFQTHLFDQPEALRKQLLTTDVL